MAAGDQQTFTPLVYWGQNREKIFLKIDISDISAGPEIDLNDSRLSFKAHGTGARGPNVYSFTIPFHQSVDAKRSKYKVTARAVEFEITKAAAGEVWHRLVQGQGKVAWIKPDFDRFTFEDSDLSEKEEEGDKLTREQQLFMDDLEKELKEAEGSVVQDLRRLYLFLYNLFQWLGFSFIFITICFRTVRYGWESRSDTYSIVGTALMVCQLAAVLEIIHPMLGWVKSGVFSALIQVFGRGLALYGLLSVEPRLQQHGIVWYLFLAWSSVELVRYPYYMLAVVDREWSVITWLRYTAWIPLYPIGFTCEGILMLLALPIFEETGKWSVSLPNTFNCSFHFPTFLRVYMVAFLLGMYTLMQHMYQLRKKKLMTTATGSVKPKSSKNKAS